MEKIDELIKQMTRIADALEGIKADNLVAVNERKKYQHGRWTPEEDLLILENWKKTTANGVADILYDKGFSRSAQSICTRYYKVLRKYKDDVDGRKYLRFTNRELDTIHKLRESGLSFSEIAKRMVELGFPKRWTSSYIQICNNKD